jgi:hypothetical protein
MKIKQMLCLGLFTLSLLLTHYSFAQMPIDAKVYVCTDKKGAVTLQNLGARADCKTRIVRVYMNSASKVSYFQSGMPDPRPAAGALMAGSKVAPAVQKGRDDARIKILLNELAQTQERLVALKTESANSGSARFNPDLKSQLSLTQANVDSLKREISSARGTTEEPFVFVLQ